MGRMKKVLGKMRAMIESGGPPAAQTIRTAPSGSVPRASAGSSMSQAITPTAASPASPVAPATTLAPLKVTTAHTGFRDRKRV
jgi:hypothetical protein